MKGNDTSQRFSLMPKWRETRILLQIRVLQTHVSPRPS